MNRSFKRGLSMGAGVLLLAVAAIVVNGCDDKKSTEAGTSTATTKTEPPDAKKQIGDLFGAKNDPKTATKVETPKVKFGAVGDDILGKAAFMAVAQENERVMDLALYDAAGTKLAKLTTDGMPKMQISPSPDGKWITFVTAPEIKPQRYDVYVCSLDGKTCRSLTDDFPPQQELVDSRDQGKGARVRYSGAPSFQSDGKKILFFSGVIGEPRNLVSIGVDGTGRTTLTQAEGKADILKYSAPHCNPKSAVAIFSRGVGRTSRAIWQRNLVSNEEKELIAAPTEQSQLDGPRWSPDGNLFAYTERAERFDRYWLHVANADGTNDRKIEMPESIQSHSFAFAWYPDGSKIAYSASPDGKQEDLFAVDVLTGAVTQLTKSPESEICPLLLR
jgi:Tol biopolymer transport system component